MYAGDVSASAAACFVVNLSSLMLAHLTPSIYGSVASVKLPDRARQFWPGTPLEKRPVGLIRMVGGGEHV